jgi:SCF-associated factor 1
MTAITDIPLEVLLDNLLPYLDVSDLCCLASTSRFFSVLVADDMLWKHKLQQDFNFSGAGTARTTGWKFLYRRLSKPKIFVWGFASKFPAAFSS